MLEVKFKKYKRVSTEMKVCCNPATSFLPWRVSGLSFLYIILEIF